MKVLLIDVNCKYSSTGKIVYDLYQRLRQDGHEAAICYGRGKLIEEENIFKFGLDWETFLHAGLARLTGLNGYFSWFSTRRLIRYMEEFQPDIVHIHEIHAYFVNLRMLLSYLQKRSIQIVWTLHCEYLYTGKCGHAYDCEKWKTSCGNCPSIKGYPKSWGLDFTKKMLRDKKKLLQELEFTIVTPSRWLAERVKESFLRDKTIMVIHNGIDTEHIFYPRRLEQVRLLKQKYGLEDKKIVLSVAPNIMSESKGGFRVVEISEKLEQEEIHFVLVGGDEERKMGKNMTLIKRITNQEQLAIWYSAADVFLLCSKRENFPTTCLEAFCCGIPVVGVDTGGARETCPEPYGVFTSDDVSELTDALMKTLDRERDVETISKLGKSLYDRQIMYRNYLRLYENAKM